MIEAQDGVIRSLCGSAYTPGPQLMRSELHGEYEEYIRAEAKAKLILMIILKSVKFI